MKYEKPMLAIQESDNIEIITTSGEWKEDINLEDEKERNKNNCSSVDFDDDVANLSAICIYSECI